jgi:hypothetical protein
MVRRAGWIALGPMALELALLLGSPAQADPASPGGTPTPPSAVVTGQRGIVVPPVVEDVEHMCALLTSCEGLPIPTNLVPADFGTCVRQMAADMTSPAAIAFSLMLRECGLGSNSCSELRTCALRGAKADTCAGRGKQTAAGFCDIEGRAVSCYHERIQAVRDCPRGGESFAASTVRW